MCLQVIRHFELRENWKIFIAVNVVVVVAIAITITTAATADKGNWKMKYVCHLWIFVKYSYFAMCEREEISKMQKYKELREFIIRYKVLWN